MSIGAGLLAILQPHAQFGVHGGLLDRSRRGRRAALRVRTRIFMTQLTRRQFAGLVALSPAVCTIGCVPWQWHDPATAPIGSCEDPLATAWERRASSIGSTFGHGRATWKSSAPRESTRISPSNWLPRRSWRIQNWPCCWPSATRSRWIRTKPTRSNKSGIMTRRWCRS